MVELSILAAGYCKQLHSAVFPAEAWRVVRFRALFALLRHPTNGVMLFDTGYSETFFEATRPFPYRLYAMALPVSCAPAETARWQLRAQGIEPEEVSTIFVSHFHADHIAGLRDFPNAQFICSRRAHDAIRDLRGIAATRRAFVPELMPDDFAVRCRFLESDAATALTAAEAPFERGFDLFGDGSMTAVELEGHAEGQMGLLVRTGTGPVFLVADAVWHSRALREGVYPGPISRLILPSWPDFAATFEKLREFCRRHPEVKIIPSHCAEVYREYVPNAAAA